MKKLTIAQARREIDAEINHHLTGQATQFLRVRLTQYMDAMETAISDLQKQIEALRQAAKN